MKVRKKIAALFVIVMMIYGTIAWAQDGSVGNVTIGSNSLTLIPAVSYAELRLTVSGEGVYWQEFFAPGEYVSADTSLLPDGSYGYEVLASPAVDDQMSEQQEKALTYIQSGNFEIKGGLIQPIAERASKSNPTEE